MRQILFFFFLIIGTLAYSQGNVPLHNLRHASGPDFIIRSSQNGQATWIKDTIYFPKVYTVASTPITAKKGDFWRSTANGNTYLWDGTTWQLIAKMDNDTSSINELIQSVDYAGGFLNIEDNGGVYTVDLRDTLFGTIDTTGLVALIRNVAPLTDSIAWSNVKNKPLTFTPSTHNHVVSDVTGLQDSLNKKAPIVSPTFTNGINVFGKHIGNFDSTSVSTDFSEYKPKDPLNNGLFRFVGGEFSNPLGGQPKNFVWNFGINMSNGGGLFNPTKPALGLSFEDKFYINGEPVTEYHLLSIGTDGIQRRPFTTYFKHDGTYGAITNFITSYKLQGWNQEEGFEIIPASGIQSYNNTSTKYRHLFYGQNYQPIWQRNDGANPVPLIGFLTGKLQLGNSEGEGVSQSFQGVRIGRVSGVDVIGSGSDNSVNLKIGYDGYRFSAIELLTGSANVLTLKSSLNTNAFNFQLPGNNAMYILQNGSYITGYKNTAFEAHQQIVMSRTYPTNGSGVSNGGIFKGEDNNLYYRNGSGVSTRINIIPPSYASTAAAAADGALTTGSFFKVTNGNGTSALHIKD